MLKQYITRSDDGGYALQINVNAMFNVAGDGLYTEKKAALLVTHIYMYIEEDASGDLQVHFNASDWDVDEDGLIYTDNAFVNDVRAALVTAGFTQELADSVDYSEAGMQGEEHVSFDAFDIADYVLKIMQSS